MHQLTIQAILHYLDDAFTHEAVDGLPCRWLRDIEAFGELLRLELVGQLAEALLIAGAAFPDNELLVLIGEVIVCHLDEEELLAAILNLHSQTAQPAVPVVHRQRLRPLPLIPMAHQDKRQRDAYAVVRDTLQKRAVGLVPIEIRYLRYSN